MCGISLALLASVNSAPDALAFFCRVAPAVTPGTPQRAFQDNRRHLDWLRAALQSRWSGGVAVGCPLYTPLAATATPAPVTLGAARRTEAYLMRRFLPCLPPGSISLDILSWKILCSTRPFWHQDAFYCQPNQFIIFMQNCVLGLISIGSLSVLLPVMLLGKVFFSPSAKQAFARPTIDFFFFILFV